MFKSSITSVCRSSCSIEKFTYLGSRLHDTWRNWHQDHQDQCSLWTSLRLRSGIKRRMKLKVYQAITQPTLLYGHLEIVIIEKSSAGSIHPASSPFLKRQDGPIMCNRDTLKSSLNSFAVNLKHWGYQAQDRPSWRRRAQETAVLCEKSRNSCAMGYSVPQNIPASDWSSQSFTHELICPMVIIESDAQTRPQLTWGQPLGAFVTRR